MVRPKVCAEEILIFPVPDDLPYTGGAGGI